MFDCVSNMWQLLFSVLFVSALLDVTYTDQSGNTCGLRPRKFIPGNDRIVGGRKAQLGSWPWMASLFYQNVNMRFCGAAIIESQWILTAAHCFDFGLDNNNWVIEVGRYDDHHVENFTRKYSVIKVITHPEFDNSNHSVYNDIAILKLNSSIDFNAYHLQLNSLCPANWDIFGNQLNLTCYTAGWGLNRKGGESPSYLKEVLLPLVDTDSCFEKFHFNFDANTQICAGGLQNGGEGTCFGDSGGPLQCLINDIWYLVGLTSYGRACALPGFPDVFTKVPAFYDWIYKTIKDNSY